MLVVEDEPTINQAVADRLVSEGFHVAQEYGGPAAVATAAGPAYSWATSNPSALSRSATAWLMTGSSSTTRTRGRRWSGGASGMGSG